MLSQADIEALLRHPSPESRALVGGKVADMCNLRGLSDREKQLADGILRVLAQDVETAVRKTLAEHLKSSTNVPHDVALKLAKDVIEVAQPILVHSEVLTDIDLVEIIRTSDADAQVAVAQRRSIPEPISDALAATGVELVVETLVKNDGAKISDHTYERVINSFSSSEAVTEGIVGRKQLPPAIVRKLIGVVSDSLKVELMTKHEVPQDVAEQFMLRSSEDTLKDLLGPEPAKRDVPAMVKSLAANRRLSGRIVMRALDIGDREFFEHGMAALAGLPYDNAVRLITDRGTQGLLAIYRKARMPEDDYPSVRYTVDKLYNLRAGSTYAPTTSPGANMVGFEGDFFGGHGWVGDN